MAFRNLVLPRPDSQPWSHYKHLAHNAFQYGVGNYCLYRLKKDSNHSVPDRPFISAAARRCEERAILCALVTAILCDW
jgi:hypothetical protein